MGRLFFAPLIEPMVLDSLDGVRIAHPLAAAPGDKAKAKPEPRPKDDTLRPEPALRWAKGW